MQFDCGFANESLCLLSKVYLLLIYPLRDHSIASQSLIHVYPIYVFFFSVHACRGHVFDGFFYDVDNDLCVMFHQATLPMYTHTQAEAACENVGSSLVTIDTEQKTDFMLRWIFTNHGRIFEPRILTVICLDYETWQLVN